MRSTLAAIGILASAISFGAGRGQAAPSGAARPDVGKPLKFRFDWAPPCRVPVVEVATKKGHTTTFRYEISARRGQGTDVEIRVGTFTLAAMDGVDTTGKEWREKLKPLAAVSSVIPAFQVSSRGEYLQTESFDRMFERMHKVGLLPPEQMENMRKALAMPLMKDVMQNVMAQYWATWVENWVDWPLSPGTERDAHVTRSMVLGTASTEADVHARFVGYRDGYAILEQTTTSTGDAVAGLVTSLVKDLRGTPSNAGLRFTAARVELRTSTETRPENLRPRRTRSEKEMYLKLSDGTEKREREIHDLTWDWDHATGCVNK